MLDTAFARHLAEDWIAAWNSHDLERVLAHYTDDFVMASPKIADFANEPSGVLHGKPAVAAYWRTALSRVPDLHFELLGVFAGSWSVAIHYKNQLGGFVVEVLEVDDARRVVRAAAHYS